MSNLIDVFFAAVYVVYLVCRTSVGCKTVLGARGCYRIHSQWLWTSGEQVMMIRECLYCLSMTIQHHIKLGFTTLRNTIFRLETIHNSLHLDAQQNILHIPYNGTKELPEILIVG